MNSFEIYVCPTPGCGNYYGSSSMGDLATLGNAADVGKTTGTRDECPDCKVRGHVVRRERRQAVLA